MSERTVATDALATLGTIIDEHQKRDAIHLAVDPVIASTALEPGQHINVKDGMAYGTAVGKGLGIVDPFLQREVEKGERFWFVMYPRMVTSLRHVWAHPAFADEGAAPAAPEKATSEQWIRDFLGRCDANVGYDDLLKAARNPGTFINTGGDGDGDYCGLMLDGEYLRTNGSDSSGEIPDELWTHVEVVIGQKVKHRASYFSCSC